MSVPPKSQTLDAGTIMCFVVVIATLLTLAFMGGAKVADAKWRRDSVAAGHAEWIQADDGSAMWRWKERAHD